MFKVIADLKAAGSRYNKKKRPELKREQHLKKRPAWKERKAVLNNRLKELLVFELTLEGHREFKPMTLRSLYTYVLNSITTRPPGSFVSTRQLTMQPVAQANSSSSDSSRHRRGTVDNDIDIDVGDCLPIGLKRRRGVVENLVQIHLPNFVDDDGNRDNINGNGRF